MGRHRSGLGKPGDHRQKTDRVYAPPRVAQLRDLVTIISITRLAVAALIAVGLTLVASPSNASDQDLPNC